MIDAMASGGWLVAFLAAQRLIELGWAHWNTTRLRASGGIEFGAFHYPFIVTLHAVWLFGFWFLAHDRSVGPIGLSLFVALQAFRLWILFSLGRRWTTRIIVLPGAPRVMRGPYRWLNHPNYVVVALEIALLPLALGLPRFALFFSIANGALLILRIRTENKALAWAMADEAPPDAGRGRLANSRPRR
jgi:methyltransferase